MSKIGHNKPPRKIGWKSVSLNKYVYKILQIFYREIEKLIHWYHQKEQQQNKWWILKRK